MKNNDSIITFYKLINRLYSINYSCERIALQIQELNKSKEFSFKMPGPKNTSWTDAKLIDLVSIRNEFIDYYNKSLNSSSVHFTIVDEQLELAKSTLVDIFNIYYDKKISLEDIFNDFICKDSKFKKLIRTYETTEYIPTDENTFNLINAYANYISCLFFKMIKQTMIDIVEQLSNDINSNGIPSLYKHIIHNSNITTMTQKDIKSLEDKIDKFYKELRSIKVSKYDRENVVKYNLSTEKYYEMDCILHQLQTRLKSANTDAVTSITNKIIEPTIDFLTGTSKISLTIDEIYVSKLEKNYLLYLEELINYSIENINKNESSNER